MAHRMRPLLAVAAVSMLIVGCSSSSSTPSPAAPTAAPATAAPATEAPMSEAPMSEAPSSPGGALEKADINVGVLPIVDVAPVYIADDQGLFSAAGLTVSTEVMQGGAAAIPALQGGDLDIAFGAWPSFLIANQNGIDLVAVADGVSATEGFTQFLAAAGSDLEGNPAGMAGQSVALNTLGNLGELSLRFALRNAGLEFSDVTPVEINFPDMGAALDNDSVQVIWAVEPGVTGNKTNLGAVTVVDSYVGDMEGFPVAGYFTTKEFAEQNPNTVAAFASAVQSAADMANSDPTVVQSIVQDYANLPEALATALHYPEYHGVLDAATLQRVYDFMQQFDMIQPGLDVSSLVLSATNQ